MAKIIGLTFPAEKPAKPVNPVNPAKDEKAAEPTKKK